MALGQDRTLSEGLADVWAKLQPNMRQFFIAWLLVMMCGAVKKLATFPMPYIAGQSACMKEVTAIPSNDIANSAFMSGGRSRLNPGPSTLIPKALHREPSIPNPAPLHFQPRAPNTQIPDTKTQIPNSKSQPSNPESQSANTGRTGSATTQPCNRNPNP